MKIELGKFVPTSNMSENKDTYCDLLMALCKEKYGEKAESICLPVIRWLETTDFFEAPASTRYHEPYPGGLVEHTLRVYNNMVELLKIAPFNACNVADATLCVLVHDWCKIGLYKRDFRNVKNPQTGVWEQVPIYQKVEYNPVPLGHGAASLYMAQRFFHMPMELATAVRWHMGEYHLANEERSELHTANEYHPLVLLIQFADRLACTKYSV